MRVRVPVHFERDADGLVSSVAIAYEPLADLVFKRDGQSSAAAATRPIL